MESELCMKCGRELKPGEVFCEACQTEMEKYPVKPGVVVLLPHRSAQPQKPVSRRRHVPVPLDEQVAKLKKWVLGLTIALILSLSAAAGLGWLLVSDWVEEQAGRFLPGQNYSSQTSSETNTMD